MLFERQIKWSLENEVSGKIRLLIVDGHAIVREGLRALLGRESDIEIVGQAANGLEALGLTAQHAPDVILIEPMLPDMNGIETMRRVRQQNKQSRFIVLANFHEERHERAALQAGATGYLIKDVSRQKLVRAIRAVALGERVWHQETYPTILWQETQQSRHHRLTERELSVLRLIASGYSNRKIADALHLTEGTVKSYVSVILEKLSVEDRTGAAIYAFKHYIT